MSRLMFSGLFCIFLLITLPVISHAQPTPSLNQEGLSKPTQAKDNDILLVTSVKLTALSAVEFPDTLRDKMVYNGWETLLSVKGPMSAEEKRLLLELSEDVLYKEAVETFYKESQENIVSTKEEIRDRILKGKPVHFVKDQDEEKRTIEAEWITEALNNKKPVKIKNAIIVDDLDLRVGKPVSIDSEELNGVLAPEKVNRLQKWMADKNVYLVSSPISIVGSILRGKFLAGLEGTRSGVVVFLGNTDFRETEFSGEVTNFSGATFSGKGGTSFSGARFSGKGLTDFSYARFSGEGGTDFSYARFSGEGRTSFYNARFSGEGGIDFSYAQFSGKGLTDFSYARFSGKGSTDFSEARFSGEGRTSFYNARFSGEGGTDFSGARFSGKGSTDFFRARFSGKGLTDFRGARFSGEGGTDFSRARFSGEGRTSFSYARFSGEGRTSFYNARFSGEGGIDFSYAQFSGKGLTDFSYARFSGKGSTDFSEARFSGEGCTSFYNARFSGEGGTSFKEATFNNTAYFKEATFNSNIDFREAPFKEVVLFSEAVFAKGISVDLSDTIYPHLYISWPQLKGRLDAPLKELFDTLETENEAEADKFFQWEEVYRRLIKNFEDIGDRQSAHDAYYHFRKSRPMFKIERLGNVSEELPQLPSEVKFPNYLKEKIFYDKKLLKFKGVMSKEEKEELLDLAEGGQYQEAIEGLFKKSREEYIVGHGWWEKAKWGAEYVFFGLTCGYGVKWRRPLYAGGVIIAIFTIVYFVGYYLKKTRKKLEKLPEGLDFPERLKHKIKHEKGLLIFKGLMSRQEMDELLSLPKKSDKKYQEAVKELFETSGPLHYPKGERNPLREKWFHNLGNSFYGSFITFSTLGLGGVMPSGWFKAAVICEGVFGWFTLALFLATLANVLLR